jgi:hypothetical protein
MKIGVTTIHVSPRKANLVSVPAGLARYATDVTTTAATYSEAEITLRAVQECMSIIADKAHENEGCWTYFDEDRGFERPFPGSV